jgi:hypothetical protein
MILLVRALPICQSCFHELEKRVVMLFWIFEVYFSNEKVQIFGLK